MGESTPSSLLGLDHERNINKVVEILTPNAVENGVVVVSIDPATGNDDDTDDGTIFQVCLISQVFIS